MKAARLIVMGTALAAAGGAGFLALNLFNREPEKQIVEVSKPSIELEQVLVAETDIPIGTNIKPDMLRWQDWPVASLSPDYITKSVRPEAIDELRGMDLDGTTPLAALQWLQRWQQSLAKEGKKGK